jgi:hypothetical protein
MDGSHLAYRSVTPRDGSKGYRISSTGGAAQKIDYVGSIFWDWSSDGRAVLVLSQTTPAGVDLIDVGANNVTPFLRRPHNVYQAHISHDGHWAIAQESGGVGVVITPFDGSQPTSMRWHPLGLQDIDLIRWSPDDDAIFFVSNRDSFRCLWGQRLDPRNKELSGEVFSIAHFHEARRSLQVFDSGEIGLAVARDKIVIAEAERTGNVWMAKLEEY